MLVLPVMEEASPYPAPSFVPGGEVDPAEADEVTWRVERDVLRRETACVVEHGSTYDTPYGSATEHHWGRVSVDTVTFEQRAQAEVTFTLQFDEPGVEVVCRSRLDVHIDGTEYAVHTDLECLEDGKPLAERRWRRIFPRELG
jgi:hypothetical protein